MCCYICFYLKDGRQEREENGDGTGRLQKRKKLATVKLVVPSLSCLPACLLTRLPYAGGWGLSSSRVPCICSSMISEWYGGGTVMRHAAELSLFSNHGQTHTRTINREARCWAAATAAMAADNRRGVVARAESF